MKEIESLEKEVQGYVVGAEKVEGEKSILQQKVDSFSKENDVLVLKIKELERKLNTVEEKVANTNVTKTNLDGSERENLKVQIDDLISRIDYHIRS